MRSATDQLDASGRGVLQMGIVIERRMSMARAEWCGDRSVRVSQAGAAVGIVLLLLLCVASPLRAQAPGRGGSRRSDVARHCRIVCSPTVSLMPGMLRTHLRGGPLVRNTGTNAEQRLPSSTNMEIIVATTASTALPRVSVFGSVQWLPNVSAQRNPFTLYSASELGTAVRANAPTATAGLSISILPVAMTGGWLDLAGNVGDLFSQAARPGDASAYTHKLDLDLVAHGNVFSRMPAWTYMHRVSLFGILDYVATGLPRAGDEVPIGRQFLSDARPLSLIVGVALPLTPPVR
jgi:hypothetical protein